MDIINDRRALHQIPELELTLPKTAAYLKNVLERLHCQLTYPLGDAICAFFDFGKEDAIADAKVKWKLEWTEQETKDIGKQFDRCKLEFKRRPLEDKIEFLQARVKQLCQYVNINA